MSKRLQARGWCFTINNDHFDDLDTLLERDFQYLIFGFEMGKNKTPHMQGYVYFEKKREFGRVRDMFYHQRAHIEMARGTPEQNIRYCSKDGEYYEFGDRPNPGKRTDLIEVKELIRKKTPMTQIAEDYFTDYIRYYKGFERYRDIQVLESSNVTYVNKDELDFDIANALYVSKEGQLWGYDNEDTLIILNQKSFDTFQLMMLEKGKPYLLGSKKICPKNVIIVK